MKFSLAMCALTWSVADSFAMWRILHNEGEPIGIEGYPASVTTAGAQQRMSDGMDGGMMTGGGEMDEDDSHNHDDHDHGGHDHGAGDDESTYGNETHTAGLNVCDTFNRDSVPDLGEHWFGGTESLRIHGNVVHRNHSVLNGLQTSYYSEYPLAEGDMQVAAKIKYFPLRGNGTMGVSLMLGTGGATDAPNFVLVSDQRNDQIYTVCSFEDGRGAWGNIIVTLPHGGRNAIGDSFTMAAALDANGTATVTISEIQNGFYAGSTVEFDCGSFPGYKDLGTGTGIGIFGSDYDFEANVNDFAHSGCPQQQQNGPLDPSKMCSGCSTLVVRNGKLMVFETADGGCTSVCAPSFMEEVFVLAGAYCGACPERFRPIHDNRPHEHV